MVGGTAARPGWWRVDAVLLGALTLGALLLPLAWPPIASRGEAREALVVRAMVDEGQWVLPWRQGVMASKPPLFHWLAAGVARVAGLSDAVVRWPSLLGAWLLAGATLATGVVLFDRRTGWLAVGIVFGSWLFWSATVARVDMLFAALVSVSLAGFGAWAMRGHEIGRTVWYLAAAAATLTKGPAGAVLPAAVAVVFCWWDGDRTRWRRLWSWRAGLAALTIVVAWYGAAVWVGGWHFVQRQLLHENVARALGQGDFGGGHRRTWTRLPLMLFGQLLPWSLVLVAAVWRAARGRREDAAGRFLHAWWFVVFLLFELSAGKRGVYLLPLLPPVALLAARALLEWSWRRAIAATAIAALVAFDATLLAVTLQRRSADYARSPLPGIARTILREVPPTAELYAALDVPENDVLILGWLVRRPIRRRRVTCDSARRYYLRRSGPRVDAGDLEPVYAQAALSLTRCRSS